MIYLQGKLLNKNQQIAMSHGDGPMMVLAGPGSGKTTVITYRIKNLIDQYGVKPWEILVITFTKASAEEMRQRFFRIMEGNPVAGKVTLGTFHSFFYRIIASRYGYRVENIFQEDERRTILKNIIYKLNLGGDDDYIQSIINELSFVKNELIDIQYHSPMNLGAEDFINIYNAYEEFKIKHNKIDFDDMMVKCHKLLLTEDKALKYWQDKYKYILIDEFQDINKIQYECIRLLAASRNNLFVVGDDDQSIYRFRGARPEFLLDFPNDFAQTEKIILDTNYRSTDYIIKLCNLVIAKNKFRYSKDISGTQKAGSVPSLLRSPDIDSEAVLVANRIVRLSETIPFHEMAVAYRTNIQARAFIDVLMNLNIPFQIKDEAPGIYEHWACRDILAYMKLSKNQSADEEAARIINKPKRYISKDLMAAAKKRGGVLHGLLTAPNLKMWQLSRVEELLFYLQAITRRKPYDAFKYIREAVGYNDYIVDYAEYKHIKPQGLFEIMDELQEGAKAFDTIESYIEHVENAILSSRENRSSKNQDRQKGVTLTTLHSAKGLEFEAVFIISAVDGLIPYEKSRTDAEIEEERRLFYVGMTRAKSILYISIIKNRYEKDVKPTPFLDGVIKNM